MTQPLDQLQIQPGPAPVPTVVMFLHHVPAAALTPYSSLWPTLQSLFLSLPHVLRPQIPLWLQLQPLLQPWPLGMSTLPPSVPLLSSGWTASTMTLLLPPPLWFLFLLPDGTESRMCLLLPPLPHQFVLPGKAAWRMSPAHMSQFLDGQTPLLNQPLSLGHAMLRTLPP